MAEQFSSTPTGSVSLLLPAAGDVTSTPSAAGAAASADRSPPTPSQPSASPSQRRPAPSTSPSPPRHCRSSTGSTRLKTLPQPSARSHSRSLTARAQPFCATLSRT
jgi:hypothetical protein